MKLKDISLYHTLVTFLVIFIIVTLYTNFQSLRLVYGYQVSEFISVQLQDFLTLSLSILIEATPFLLVGTLISILIQNYVPAAVFSKIIPRNIIGRRLVMSFSGMLLPVCECGNVPIARSLMNRGVSVGDAITFLLAAPILNPIVLLTTWQAFRFDTTIVYGRFIAAFLIANIVAIIVTLVLRRDQILTKDFAATCDTHHHTDRSVITAARDFTRELWPLLKMLCFGAVIAGLIQVFVPREVIVSIGSDPILGVVTMIALGFVISICSSVDAFFALAFARTFQSGSLTAFLVAGPMVDIKMIALLKTTFSYKAIALITAIVFICTLLTGIIINYTVA